MISDMSFFRVRVISSFIKNNKNSFKNIINSPIFSQNKNSFILRILKIITVFDMYTILKIIWFPTTLSLKLFSKFNVYQIFFFNFSMIKRSLISWLGWCDLNLLTRYTPGDEVFNEPYHSFPKELLSDPVQGFIIASMATHFGSVKFLQN